MKGVAYAIAQLSNQLEAVVIESDLALTFKGKISPVTTHAQGPQLPKTKVSQRDSIRRSNNNTAFLLHMCDFGYSHAKKKIYR